MQAGSSAIREFIGHVQNKTPSAPRPLRAVVVRHPLARLASAYRDKFLTGKLLFEYDDKWRNVTQSAESWETRFDKYWLPALVSEGFLDRNRKFNETLSKIRKTYQVYMDNFVSQSGALLTIPSQEENQFYGVEEMETAYLMIYNGPHIGFSTIFRNAYNVSDLAQRFRNTSFSFSQFLHHVVWTHDMGMPDEHWMTYTETCDPCRMKFDYVLKLETIQEEMQHLLCGVLGFPERVSIPVKHRSYGHGLGHSDREYYANVSRELMDRLLHIYRHDFAIFGYSRDL
ncbi:carbohydrate sulfotransferase 12-like [Eriocheir sinensis]|uniref:carbohydrate sulfotransferase 12-like n=1 Tax=Eriocheir sinensis TaxID=95602 RepID=UPI0021C70066|nr:carbohydrate sulfotransferase 12-like [Eriocheir sinensis]